MIVNCWFCFLIAGGLLDLADVDRAGAAETATSRGTTNWLGPIATTNAFTVFGRITGPEAQPIAGAQLRACCGIGTLNCTGTTTSDSNGLYVLAFGPGVLMGSRLSGGYGVGLQAATIFADKTGYACDDLGRAGNLGMTDLDRIEPERTGSFAGIVYPFKPYRLDFVLRPAATIKGLVRTVSRPMPEKLTLSLVGKALPPSSSALSSIELLQTNAFVFPNVPVGSNWWFEASWRKRAAWKSARTEPFSCTSAQEYMAVLEFSPAGNLKLRALR